jgi:hypothetical protein
MKKIKLEVVVDDEDALDVLNLLQKVIIRRIYFYCLALEECDGQD